MTNSTAGSTTTDGRQMLSVVADLRLESAGQRIQLVGDGQSLVMHIDSPRALLTAMKSSSLPAATGVAARRRSIGRVADTLSRAGLRVDVRGPAGVLVSLGHGAGSRSGRLLTGSRAVTIGPAGEVAAGLTSGLPLGRIAAASVATATVALAVYVLRRHLR